MEEQSRLSLEEEQTDGWLSIREAATKLNLSEKTLRKRIKEGELEKRLIATRTGPAYQVRVVSVPSSAPRVEAELPSLEEELLTLEPEGTQLGGNDAVSELVSLVKDLQTSLSDAHQQVVAAHQEIVTKAETAAMWQARAEMLMHQLSSAQETIKMLEAPKEKLVEEIKQEEGSREESLPWWKVWLRALG
jgi:DNA-binding Lrp family transcriptional regulator